MSTGHLVLGPRQHGVVRLAEDVLATLPGPLPVVRRPGVADLGPGWERPLAGCTRVHLHYTDRLFGARCEEAARTFGGVAAHLHAQLGTAVSVTLHDLPQPGDGPALHLRRADCYRTVLAAVDAVVVSSHHEAALLADLAGPPRPVSVVPLPVQPPPPGLRPGPTDGQVTVLGFLHPGKGHGAVLEAMRTLPAGVGMVALGRAAEGHDDLVPALTVLAGAVGRGLRVTGFVADAELPVALRRAGVPVAPNPNVSASASLTAWLSAGRRPLVPVGRYPDELLRRSPGAVWPYRAHELPDALDLALAEPGRTWLGPDVALGPGLTEVAAAYSRVWSR